MAFNPAYQLRRTRSNTSYQNESSSLVERANSLLSESQSLWVLFSPSLASENVESDILSLTVDSQVDDADADAEGEEEEEQEEEDATSEVDSLIDNLKSTSGNTPFQLEQMLLNYAGADNSALRKRINKWKSSQDIPPVESVDDDNIASWDLDENIITELLEQSTASSQATSLSSSPNLKDGYHPRKFYGDDIFKNCSKRDLIRFKKIANNLKTSLSRKEDQSSSLMKMFEKHHQHQHQHQQQEKNAGSISMSGGVVGKRYSTLLSEYSNANNRHFLSTVIENQLRNSSFSHRENDVYGLQHDIHSSTASSSLVMCGGVGFGTSSSWNEI